MATLRSVCVAACALLANLLTDADADAGMQGMRHAPQRDEHDVVSCIGLANFALEAHGCDGLARSAALDLLAACADAGGVRCGAFIAARGSLAHMRRALRRNVTVAVAAAAAGDGRAEKHALQGEMRAMRALQTLASKSRGLGALCTAARAPHAILAAAARTPPLSYDAAEVGSGDATGAKTSYEDLHLCVCAALFTFIPFAAAAISGADWLPAALRHAVTILLARPRAFDVVTAVTCIVTSITHEDAAAARALRAWADAPPPAPRARADMSARCWDLLGNMASAALQQHAAPAGGAGGAAVARAAALARFGAFDARDSAGDAHEDDGAAYGTCDDVAAADWPRRVMSDPVAAAASEVLRILPPGSPEAGVDAALRRSFGGGDEDADARTLPPARAQSRAARRGAPSAPAAVPAADAAAARAAADAAMAALLAEDDAAKSAAEKTKAKARAKKQRQKAGKQGGEGAGGAGPSQAADADVEEDASVGVAVAAPAAAAIPAAAVPAAPLPAPAAAALARAPAAQPAARPAAVLPPPPPPEQQLSLPPLPAQRPLSPQHPLQRVQHSGAAPLSPPLSSPPPSLAPWFPAPLPLPAAAAAEPASGADDDLQELLAHLQLSAVLPALPASAPPHAEAAAAARETAAEEEAEDCCFCMIAPPSARLSPCGHAAMCGACTARVVAHGNGLCPMCRARIVSYEER
jgi:hypothetical protein